MLIVTQVEVSIVKGLDRVRWPWNGWLISVDFTKRGIYASYTHQGISCRTGVESEKRGA
jgi:hypothetical protein